MIRILFGLILGLILGVLLARSFAKPPKHTWQYETVWLRTDGEPSIPRTSPISLDDLNKEGKLSVPRRTHLPIPRVMSSLF
jgi:hypothetical protein